MQEIQIQFLGQEDALEEELATYFNILAWEIPWTEEPGGLQFMGLQRVGHNRKTENTHTFSLTRAALWSPASHVMLQQNIWTHTCKIISQWSLTSFQPWLAKISLPMAVIASPPGTAQSFHFHCTDRGCYQLCSLHPPLTGRWATSQRHGCDQDT